MERHKEKLDPNKPLGTINLGAYTLLIYPRAEGGYFFRPYKSDRTDLLDRTRDLAPNSISSFTDFDPELLEMAQIGTVLAPQVTWRGGSGVLDEPQVTITGKDAFSFDVFKTTLFDSEIVDLFTKPVAGSEFKSASLLYLNTSAGDIMGIAIRRNTPVVLLMAPSIEGFNGSSKEGLNNLLAGILNGLTTRLTVFETQVLNALAEANSTDYFQYPYDQATLGGKLQNNLLMQIYTAKTFFLARNAETTGEGLNNRALLEYFPYLKTVEKKTGLASLLASAGQPRKLKLEPSLWNGMVEDASQGVSLRNPHDKTPRPAKVTPFLQRGQKIIAPQVMTAEEVAALKRQASAQASPEFKSREESVTLAKPSLEKLAEFLGNFATARPEKLSQNDLSETAGRLKNIAIELEKIIAVKKKGRPPMTATSIELIGKSESLKMFGVLAGKKILDFFVPTNGLGYLEAIEKSTQSWLTDSDFQNSQLRSDPKARSAATLLTSTRLAPLAEHYKTTLGLRDIRMINQAIDLVWLTYYILTEKTVYLLLEAGQQLCQSGQEVEINNWAHYSHAAIKRLIDLADQVK